MSSSRRESSKRHCVGSQGCRSHLHALTCICAQSIEATKSRHLPADARLSPYNDLSGRRQRPESRVTYAIAVEFADAVTADAKRARDFVLQPARIRRRGMSFIKAELTANDFAARAPDRGGERCWKPGAWLRIATDETPIADLDSTRCKRGGSVGKAYSGAGSAAGCDASELPISEKKEVQSASRRASNCLFQGAADAAGWTSGGSVDAEFCSERDARDSCLGGAECDER